jgi:hypothetical protein
MTALEGNKYTVAGRAVFMPPEVKLHHMQEAHPGFLVVEGWTPEALEHLERQQRERQAQDKVFHDALAGLGI